MSEASTGLLARLMLSSIPVLKLPVTRISTGPPVKTNWPLRPAVNVVKLKSPGPAKVTVPSTPTVRAP